MTDLKDMCRCMRVSRRWEVLARDVIRLYESLFLFSSEAARMDWAKCLQMESSHTDLSDFLKTDVVTGPFHDSFNNCINQMRKLNSIVASGELLPAFIQTVQQTIGRNAATLSNVSCHSFPFPEDAEVQYPNLKVMSCLTVTSEVIASCPILEGLQLPSQKQQNVLQSVVNKQLLTELALFSHPEIAAAGIWEMLDGLKMLTNLKEIRLQFRNSYDWNDHKKAWDTLFYNYHHLTEVHIWGNEKAINFDEAVRNLVRGNPQLKIFDLTAFWVTDAALTHLAELTHLEKLILIHSSNEITADGVLTLLRGSSRNVIREIQVRHNDAMFPAAPFLSELMLIAQVTGKLLDVDSGYQMIRIGSSKAA